MPNLAWCDVLRDVRFPFVYIGVVTLVLFFGHAPLCKNVATESMANLRKTAMFCVNIDLFFSVINLKGFDLENCYIVV